MTRSNPIATLCLVRHGVTAPQEERRYCGHSDPPLSARGASQIVTLREKLSAWLTADTLVFTSDLRRAAQSAALLADGARIIALPELREIHFGEWEGKRFEETGCGNPEELRDPNFRFPGGESIAMVAVRVRAAAVVIRQRLRQTTTTTTVLVVAHAGSLAALTLQLQQLPLADFWNHILPHGGSAWLDLNQGESG